MVAIADGGAVFTWAHGEGDDDRGLTTDDAAREADILWGEIDFTKTFAEPAAGGEQATFRLYDNYTDAKAGSANWIRNATFQNNATTGKVSITGLRASNHIDGKADQPAGTVKLDGQDNACVPTTGYIVYWLTEVAAPESYELLAKPVPVVLTVEDNGGTVTSTLKEVELNADGSLAWETDASSAQLDEPCTYKTVGGAFTGIENVQKNAGFNLPLTGGWGTIWLMVAGGALLAVVLVAARRRKAEEA